MLVRANLVFCSERPKVDENPVKASDLPQANICSLGYLQEDPVRTSTKYLLACIAAMTVSPLCADEPPRRRLPTNRLSFDSVVEETAEITESAEPAQEETTATEAPSEIDASDVLPTVEPEVTPEEEQVQEVKKRVVSIPKNVVKQPTPDSEIVDPTAPIEVIEEKYDSGNVKIRREMTLDREGNYIKHGDWTMYSESGEEVAFGKFVGNQRQGTWKKTINWGASALLNELPYPEFEAPFVSQAEFSNGKLNGLWTISDKQGRIASEWHYVDGKLNGKAKWFLPDGRIREEIDYTDGLMNGNYRLVDSDGTELNNDTYQQGRKLASKQETYENGVLRWEGMFLHERFVVASEDDWWKTKPVAYRTVGEPERHGEFTSWFENGQKKFSGSFEHEIRVGEFTWWHENTQVAVTGQFVEGERDGQWVWWHQNGQKAIQGHYVKGKLDSNWAYWNAEGKLERKVDYDENNSNPIAVHSIPTTDIRMTKTSKAKTVAAVAKPTVSNVPVGTGVRMAGKSNLPRNPFRK